MKRKIIVLIVILIANLSNAQNEVDALRYSQLTFGGTARYNSMAGAFGALGAEFSTLSSNPAGISIYKKWEISFTPSIFSQTTNSSYNGKSSSDSKYNFNFGNAGIVGTFNTHKNENESGWVSWNFGFGYNKMANFNNRINMQGPNSGESSLSDVYVINANGLSPSVLDPFAEGLAFDTYVIDTLPGNQNQYFSNVPLTVSQSKSIETSGSMGETVLSYGGNYNNKLYLGATLGFPHINYSENIAYSESSVQNDTLSGFKSFKLEQDVSTRGTGINIKLGLIYRLTDWMRIGAAFHSPTAFTMHDDYVYTMNSSFSSGNYSQTSPNGSFDYSLNTPPRFIGSVGFIIAKKGLIGFDIEEVDYSYSRISSSSFSFSDVNNQIHQKYVPASNIRVGGELKIIESFALRAGFSMYGNPYKSGINSDASRLSYTAGFGFRKENFFYDFGYVLTQYKENYYLYDPGTNVNPVENKFSSSRFLMTFGTKF